MHSSCYQIKKQSNIDEFVYAAESLLWNNANYSSKLDERILKSKMVAFIEKIGFTLFSDVFFSFFLTFNLFYLEFGTLFMHFLQEKNPIANKRGIN